MNRQFDNPHQLTLKQLERRFAQSDDSARFEVVTYVSPFDETFVRHYVGIETSLNDAEVTTILEAPITTEEQNYQTEFDADRRAFRTEYNERVTQLRAIEDNTSPTNAQVVAAVRYLAQTLRLVLRLLVKTRFS